MEAFLNGVWGVLAVAALLAWRRQTHSSSGHARRLVALWCMLLLMFPVISATDDLHPVAQAVEEASKRNQKAATGIKCQTAHLGHCSAMLPATISAVAPPLCMVEWLGSAATPSAPNAVTFAERGRAPPSSSLA